MAYFGPVCVMTREHREAVWSAIMTAWANSARTPEVQAALAAVVQELQDQRMWFYATDPVAVFRHRTSKDGVLPHP